MEENTGEQQERRTTPPTVEDTNPTVKKFVVKKHSSVDKVLEDKILEEDEEFVDEETAKRPVAGPKPWNGQAHSLRRPTSLPEINRPTELPNLENETTDIRQDDPAQKRRPSVPRTPTGLPELNRRDENTEEEKD